MPVCPACSQPFPAAQRRCSRCSSASGDPASTAKLSRSEAWAAVIGPRRTEYYLRRFAVLSGPGAHRLGWHWPAFVAPLYWFLYRKMWRWAAAYALVLPLLLLADGSIASASGPFRIALDGVAVLLLVGLGLVLPALVADWLYLAHCNRLIRVTRRGGSRHRYVTRLAARGGTSEAAAGVAAVFSGFVVLGIVGGLGLAVWVDYSKRERVVEALRVGAVARAAVAAFVDRRGTIPVSWQEVGVQLPAHVLRIALDPRTGTIEIDTQISKAEAGAIRLVPEVDGAERIVWTCRADPAIEPFGPRSCQATE